MAGNDINSTSAERRTGSSKSGEPVFLVVGRLRRPHGIHGEIIMDVLTDFPERLRVKRMVYVGENRQPLRIQGLRPHNQALLMKFDGYDTPDQVGEFRNQLVSIQAHSLPVLPEGEYYHHQLMGITVLDEAGVEIGTLSDIIETGARDVYVVTSPEKGELLFPAIDSVILKVDLENKQMIIRPQTWE